MNISKRCDGIMDCLDKSDEFNCHKVVVDKQYYVKAMIPDPPKQDHDANGKLKVYVDIEVLDIHALNEVHSMMTLQLKLTLKWIDTRLRFQHLKTNEDWNKLTPEEMDQIWMPELVFPNTKNRKLANFRNLSTFVNIKINEGFVHYLRF